MKIKALSIFIIIFQFNSIAIGQENDIDPNNPIDKIELILGVQDEASQSANDTYTEIEIPFWSNYDFGDNTQYSILIYNLDANEDELYRVSDLAILRLIQEKYNHPTTIFNNHCNSNKSSSIALVKDKQVIEFAELQWDCNILVTKDGPINFDTLILSNNLMKISSEDENENFTTKDELDNAIERVMADENIFLFKNSEDFLGKTQFVFQGGVDDMNNLLNDELYLKLAKERLEDQRNGYLIDRKSLIELDEDGQLLEFLVRSQVNNFEIEIEEWSISEENPQDYIITVSYSNEDFILKLENVINHRVVSKYRLDYLRIKK